MHEALREAVATGYARGLGCALGRTERTPAGTVGEKLGHRVGSSIEFMDFREYAPGDDLRRIDWAAYARSDRLMVRLYREEVTPHLDLLVDGSTSMDLPETPKGAATLGTAALLSGAAENTRWSRRAFVLDTAETGALVGAELEGGDREPAGWNWPGFGGQAGAGAGVGELRLRRRGLRVVVSDLLFDGDPEATVTRWAEGAAALWVVQVLAAQDADPRAAAGFDGDVRLVDAEQGTLQEVRLDAGALRAYRDALAQHRARWADALRRVEGRLVTVVAEELVPGWGIRGLVNGGVLSAL